MTDLAGWSRRRLGDGTIELVQPTGMVWLKIVLGPPSLPTRRGDHFVTEHGEHGVVYELDEETVAIVVTETRQLLVRGIGFGIRDTVVRFARTLEIGVSPQRNRMFVYTPPTGFVGVRRALATAWIAPAHSIIVCDAVPRGHASLAHLMWPSMVTAHVRTDAITQCGLAGQLACWETDDEHRAEAELFDHRFVYRFIARGRTSLAGELLRGVIATARPIPNATANEIVEELAIWT